MKIIASIADGRYRQEFMVSASSDELAMITTGASDSEYGHFKIGQEILVREQWRRVREIAEAQIRLDAAGKNLRAIADLLGTIDVVVPPAEEKEAK